MVSMTSLGLRYERAKRTDRMRRDAPALADGAEALPTRPRRDRGCVVAPSLLHRVGALAAEPRHAPGPRRGARRPAAGAQLAPAGGGIRERLSRELARRSRPRGRAAIARGGARADESLSVRGARSPVGGRPGESRRRGADRDLRAGGAPREWLAGTKVAISTAAA